MQIIKAALILLLIFTYILFAVFLHLITFSISKLRYQIISRTTRILSRSVRKILGIKLYLEGELSYFAQQGNFIISNHLGYLDGIILSSLFSVIFITKLQVKSWPIMGWMAKAGCTIFINRKKKLNTGDYIADISSVLKQNVNILFFPECTSSDGSKILPFNPAYFQAPLNIGSAIIPITIQYTKVNSKELTLENRDKIFWYGQVPFQKHLAKALNLKTIEAKITIHPKIETSNYNSNQPQIRKQLSALSQETISRDFVLMPDDKTQSRVEKRLKKNKKL